MIVDAATRRHGDSETRRAVVCRAAERARGRGGEPARRHGERLCAERLSGRGGEVKR